MDADETPTSKPRPRFLLLDDVAAELSTSKAQVYAMVRSGDLPAIKVGGRGQWRVELAKLEEYIAKAYTDTATWVQNPPGNTDDPEDEPDEPPGRITGLRHMPDFAVPALAGRGRRYTRIEGDVGGPPAVGSGWEFNACPGSPIRRSLRAHAEPAASTRSFAPPAPTGCIGIAWSARPPANLPLAGPTRFARSPTTTFARIASVDDASSTSEKLGVPAQPELVGARCGWRAVGGLVTP